MSDELKTEIDRLRDENAKLMKELSGLADELKEVRHEARDRRHENKSLGEQLANLMAAVDRGRRRPRLIRMISVRPSLRRRPPFGALSMSGHLRRLPGA